MRPAPSLLVSFPLGADQRAIVAREVGDVASIMFLEEEGPERRAEQIASADVVLTINPFLELSAAELPLLRNAKLLQFRYVGTDHLPLNCLPPGLPLANNAGALAEPMAEHGAAMALAAAKRLRFEQDEMRRGRFNQLTETRMLAGGVCGIYGFGGIGVALARIMRAFGVRIHAVNRRGRSDEPTDWIGGPEHLDALLAASDVFFICSPLTPDTIGILDAARLRLMKPDAILVNLARGEIVGQGALYQHLVANPSFTACLDAWWVEPLRHGRFALDYPLLDLPNVLASPHNSACGQGWQEVGLIRALANCRRVLAGGEPLHRIGRHPRFA